MIMEISSELNCGQTNKKIGYNVIVVDNLLSESYQKDIENVLASPEFPWYFIDEISKGDYTNPNVTESFGLVHTLYDSYNGVNSNYFPYFKPILYSLEEKTGLKCERILRIRIRKTTSVPNHTSDKYNRPHIDLPEANHYKTLVYYVDDSDGDTFLFNEMYEPGMPISMENVTEYKRNSPKKGTGVVFDGHRYHAGNNPVNFKQRTIINFDFIST